jgi:hypothetical protein
MKKICNLKIKSNDTFSLEQEIVDEFLASWFISIIVTYYVDIDWVVGSKLRGLLIKVVEWIMSFDSKAGKLPTLTDDAFSDAWLPVFYYISIPPL